MPAKARLPVRFFPSRARLRLWFERNHDRAHELWIGYYRRGSGKRGVTYAEAVEEALCFGWIDGQVRSIDSMSYANRYTPRRPGSRWSRTNLATIERLRREGRLRPAGARAAADARPARYSFEPRPRSLSAALAKEFRDAPAAWRHFSAQPPGYRRTASFWVMSAQREATRRRRLRVLIESSARGERIDLLRPGRRPSDPARSAVR